MNFPTNKKYNVIYSDPPWSYNDKLRGHTQSLDHEYQTMPLEAICALPVQEIAADDCLLFIWVPSPLLPEGLQVIEAWGFKYITVAFNWVKVTDTGKVAHLVGHWTHPNSELCLLGRRGSPKRKNNRIMQLVMDTRNAHSQKPDVVRDRITTLMGDVPRIELFARMNRPGWDAYGNEVNKFDADHRKGVLVHNRLF